jgi:hypothetical protein
VTGGEGGGGALRRPSPGERSLDVAPGNLGSSGDRKRPINKTRLVQTNQTSPAQTKSRFALLRANGPHPTATHSALAQGCRVFRARAVASIFSRWHSFRSRGVKWRGVGGAGGLAWPDGRLRGQCGRERGGTEGERAGSIALCSVRSMFPR